MFYQYIYSRLILRKATCSLLLLLLLVMPFQVIGDTIMLTKSGPQTAREGDLIEYRLKAINESNTDIDNVRVLDDLPAEVDFVEAISTLNGVYEPSSGIWEVPILGTSELNKTAELQLRVLVKADILSSPNDVVTVTNHAGLLSPAPTDPNEVAQSTNIVCASCIDWEIVSVKLDSEWRGPDTLDPFEMRYLLYVTVVNNGPVASQGSLTSTYFNVSYTPSLTLQPDLPVMVSLDEGETKTFLYSTNWVEGPDSTYTIAWEFTIIDDSFLDPVEPNVVSGLWTGEVTGGGKEACFIATAAYGSYLDPHVQSLRIFRDETLMRSRTGRKLVSVYYEFSPPIARYIAQDELLKKVTRIALIPVIFTIETPFIAFSVFGMMLFLAFKYRSRRKYACTP
jgi:uncharacterized repeat protein (TIGR01451 family)